MSILTPPRLHDGPRWRGMRVGLLGGSFNPPHRGHLHIARIAQARFGLDFVWWLVTPQNPLKSQKGLAPYEERFAQVETLINGNARMMATHLEREIGSRYTFDTLAALRHAFPHTDFLWICGMDNALIFHKWDRWRDLLAATPVTFIARPPASTLVQSCPVRLNTDVPHHHGTRGARTDISKPGIYWLSSTRMMDISSTQIRSKNNNLP